MQLDYVYPALPATCFHHQAVDSLPQVRAGHFNQPLAQRLGWTADQQANWINIINGEQALTTTSPLAMAYAGHQFGHWAGQLGDGRGVLLAQIRDRAGQLTDLHVKGAGRTPYSRGGDGRAVLRSVIREYLAGHALNHLGVASSDAVGFIYSHALPVWREKVEPAAMLLRVSDCHIRFGHFEWFNHYAPEQLPTFFEFCLTHYYPELTNHPQPVVAFADAVLARTARMIAHWQLVGFAHGVMNTDNLNITGTTLDFGPYGFMQRFQPDWINNHSDHSGRYTYQNQPGIAHWNLWVLFNNLMPLADYAGITTSELQQQLMHSLAQFEPQFLQHYQAGLQAKLGLAPTSDQQVQADNFELGLDFLRVLQARRLDYTNSFRRLADGELDALLVDADHAPAMAEFLQRYAGYATDTSRMQQHNPVYIMRNQMAQQAIAQAEADDLSEVGRLFDLLAQPFKVQPDRARAGDRQPLPADQPEVAVSCSS